MRRIADEVDRPQSAVFLHLTRYAADATLFERIVAVSVKGHHEQAAVGSSVEAHALVHDVSVIRFGDGDTLGSLVGRECHYRTAPVSAVGRGDKQGLPRRLLLVNGIG